MHIFNQRFIGSFFFFFFFFYVLTAEGEKDEGGEMVLCMRNDHKMEMVVISKNYSHRDC